MRSSPPGEPFMEYSAGLRPNMTSYHGAVHGKIICITTTKIIQPNAQPKRYWSPAEQPKKDGDNEWNSEVTDAIRQPCNHIQDEMCVSSEEIRDVGTERTGLRLGVGSTETHILGRNCLG